MYSPLTHMRAQILPPSISMGISAKEQQTQKNRYATRRRKISGRSTHHTSGHDRKRPADACLSRPPVHGLVAFYHLFDFLLTNSLMLWSVENN